VISIHRSPKKNQKVRNGKKGVKSLGHWGNGGGGLSRECALQGRIGGGPVKSYAEGVRGKET